MNQDALLDQLIDIYTPEPIGWWPLASGWWFLLALTLVGLTAILYLLILHRKRNIWKRQAQQELGKLFNATTEYSLQKNINLQLIQLIRRCLFMSSKDQNAFSATGEQLVSLLESRDKKGLLPQELKDLIKNFYQTEQPAVSADVYAPLKQWVKSL